MAFPEFVDVAKYQPSTLTYFKSLKRHGAKGSFVQLNYGPWPLYDNQRAGEQLTNSLKTMEFTGCYEYFCDYPEAEAKHFINLMKSYGMDKSTPVMLDVESGSGPQTHLINEWTKIVYDAGFHNIWVYSMSSWFENGQIKPELLHHGKLWVANYGASQPGVNNASAWQFTDNWHGMNTDGDYLFIPLSKMTGKSEKQKHHSKQAQYLKAGERFKCLSSLNIYRDLDFHVKSGNVLAKGSIVKGRIIKYSNITRIDTALGFISANANFIKGVK